MQPHPNNPVATQAANCRPAGRIFQKDGTFYRPGQNNASRQYGLGLTINEIEVLTAEAISEKVVMRIDPSTLGLSAVHHLDFTAGLMVIGISK